jgi:hypothetical protein
MSQYLDQGLERWIYRTAHENKWRVPSYIDLISEGFACYQKCVDRYARLQRKRRPTKEDRKNFMALVKITFTRRITDLAYERSRMPDRYVISQITAPDQSFSDWLDRNSPAELAAVDIGLMIEQAPSELRHLLVTLSSDVGEAAAFVKVKCGRYYRRETSNQRLCRLLGLKRKAANKVDILKEVHHYFEHGEWLVRTKVTPDDWLRGHRSKLAAVCS